MAILIKDIKITNFRSLKEVSIELDNNCTVLVGKNNCGKSNIIQAIGLAFNYSTILKEDIFISPQEPFDESKKITIDVRILPIDKEGVVQDSFEDVWARSFGDSRSIDNTTDKEYLGFRTVIAYDQDKEIYTNIKYKINNWKDEGDSKIGTIIKRNALENIEIILVDAQRDISLDIKDRKSIWGELTSKMKVSDKVRGNIETQLNTLNKKIVHESDILKAISKELKSSTADKESKVDISPITRDIETLYRGMNIYYTSKDSSPTSVENLGLGVRSWAVFSTVKAEIMAKIKKRSSEDIAYHPLILVEEPEAHVHPQAQRQLFSDISALVGQKVITTHSPYILSQIELNKIKYVRKIGACSETFPLLIAGLNNDELRKIRRTVMNTRGEILYSNAVILAEGETEEQAITVFLRKHFNKEPFELGINVIGVGGSNYLPFMRMLNRMSIRWYVFSDGESLPVKRLKDCVKNTYNEKEVDLSEYPNIIVLEDGHSFETYIVANGYSKEIIKAINRVEVEDGRDANYFEWYIKNNHGQKDKYISTGKKCEICNQTLRTGTLKDYTGNEGKKKALIDCITTKGAKTKYATAIAEEICGITNRKRMIPNKLKDLFIKIQQDLEDGEL